MSNIDLVHKYIWKQNNKHRKINIIHILQLNSDIMIRESFEIQFFDQIKTIMVLIRLL